MDSILNSILYIVCVLVIGIVIMVVLFKDSSSTSTDVSSSIVSDVSSSTTTSHTTSPTTETDTVDTDTTTSADDKKRELWTRSCDLEKCNEAVWSVGDKQSDIWGGNCKQADDYLTDCKNGSNGTMHCPAYVCDPNQNDCLELKDCGGSFDTTNHTFGCGTQNIDVSCDNGTIATAYTKYKA